MSSTDGTSQTRLIMVLPAADRLCNQARNSPCCIVISKPCVLLNLKCIILILANLPTLQAGPINSSPNTNDIWVQSFHTLKNCCNRGEIFFFKYMNYVSIFVVTVWKCPFLFYRSRCPNYFVHIMNVQVIGVW